MANAAEWEQHRHDPDWAPAGAENGPDLYRRTQAAMRRIVHRHEGLTVAVVMHGGGLRMYFCHLFGLSLEHYWQVVHRTCQPFHSRLAGQPSNVDPME